MHLEFENMYNKLDDAFNSAVRLGNTERMGGVVGLVAQMCVDAILRNKLDEKGGLSACDFALAR